MARFVKGQSGNPAGKPLGARHTLNEAFVRDLNEIWKRDGMQALERLSLSEPAKLVEAVGRTLPRELAVSAQERNSLGVDPARCGPASNGCWLPSKSARRRMQTPSMYSRRWRSGFAEFALQIEGDR
jgi:hypothetical protein